MKTIKNALLASSMLVLSAGAFASTSIPGDYSLHHTNKTIKTATVDSKVAAYNLGFEKLSELKSESASELSSDLAAPVSSFKEANSVELDDGAYITVQESMNAQGNIVYNGLVNVSYSYSQAN